MPLHFLDNILRLNLPLETPKGVFQRLSLLEPDFSHSIDTPYFLRCSLGQLAESTESRCRCQASIRKQKRLYFPEIGLQSRLETLPNQEEGDEVRHKQLIGFSNRKLSIVVSNMHGAVAGKFDQPWVETAGVHRLNLYPESQNVRTVKTVQTTRHRLENQTLW